MTDWDRIERLRSKGWDWDRIAADEKVEFHAEEGAGDPGRALRALYYQRRSRAQRRPSGTGKDSDDGGDAGGGARSKSRWSFARIGFLLVPLTGLWLVLALAFPSPIGVFVTAIPDLAIALLASAAVLGFGLLRAGERWNTTFRNTLIAGSVLGLVVAGGIGVIAIAEGCPSLSASSSSEPQSWSKSPNAAWSSNGAPVLFFYGAYACPYCSATSWAIYYALTKVGSATNVVYGHSSPSDVYASTPEIDLDQLSVVSQYVDLVATENHDPTVAQGPGTSSCIQQAYISAYDSCTTCGIPFVVLNGQYWHEGTIVEPQNGTSNFALNSYSPQQVMGNLQNQSGPAWDLIGPEAYWILSFIVKVNDGNPQSAKAIPQVAGDLAQIT